MSRPSFRGRQLQTQLGRVRRDERINTLFDGGVLLRIQNNRITAVSIKPPLEAPFIRHRGAARGAALHSARRGALRTGGVEHA